MTASTEVHDAILVLNSGSSSLKCGVFRAGALDEELLLSGSADGIGRESGSLHLRTADGQELISEDHVMESQADALRKLADALQKHLHAKPVAVGHRIVHGGPKLRRHQQLTPAVLDQLKAAVHFAPLHIPQALALVKQAQAIFPDPPHFACFDTAFHLTLPEVACHLPLPLTFYEQGVIRYGFHGLSYESVCYRLNGALPAKMIVAHLGNGCSVTAMRDGQSVDTSMGLTPTGGVPMGTRSGDLDPGVLLYLLRTEKLDADGLETLLNHTCGLAGFSGGESDMQALLQRADSGDAAAALAVEAFCTAVRKTIGSYAALLGGVDRLVFTGGIGEHSDVVRRRICEGLEFIGLSAANDGKVVSMRAEEELQMARHCRELLKS